MGNLANTLKRLIANKNFVTILAVFAGIIALWMVYNWRVKEAINPILVPFATKELTAGTMITQDDIDTMEISNDNYKKANVFTQAQIDELIGKYVALDTNIPKGGMFFIEQCVEEKDLKDDIMSNYDDGKYTIKPIKVDNVSTYGNSITPGSKTDLFVRYTENDILYNVAYIKNIEVVAVKDSEGNDVFADYENRKPEELWFVVKNEYEGYFDAAEAAGVEIFAVPRGANSKDDGNELGLGYENALHYMEAKVNFEK